MNTSISSVSSTPPHNICSRSNLNGLAGPNQMSSLASSHQLGHELSSTTASTLTPLSATAVERSASRVVAAPIEIKLFVGRVPKTFDDSQLRAVFSEFGVVRDVIIIRDRETGTHKGCAFVRMASITKADAAVRQLNNIRVLDSGLGPLQVKYAFGEPERLGLLIENCQPGVDQGKLFVGSLPKSATEEEIHCVFSRFGAVDEVFVIRDEQKVSKGCGFVRFAFKEEAFSAIANLNGKFTMPSGTKAIEVRFAENKKSQQPYTNPPSLHRSNASGWLEYVSPEGRPYYYSLQTGHTRWERPIELDFTPSLFHTPQHPNVVPGGVGAQTHGPPGANVFIFHIPNDWSEHDLVSNFSPFGQIVSARIATDKGSGRRLGFGFVSFSTIEASVQAVIALNGFSVSGKRLKVTIKRGEEQYAAPFLPHSFNNQQSGSSIGNNCSRLLSHSSFMDTNPNSTLNNHHLTCLPHSDCDRNQPRHQLPFNRNSNSRIIESGHPISTMGLPHANHGITQHCPNVPNYPTHHPHLQHSTFNNFPSAHHPYGSPTVIPSAVTIAH